jgi:DNA-binding transcriptional MerR regulator
MYKINELASIAGISTRTLRYYDQIGLLNPYKIDDNQYRLYNEENVDRLQQILFYKELGYSLQKITLILTSTTFNRLESLYEHVSLLENKKVHIESVLNLVLETIEYIERGETMSDKQKFDAFKKQTIQDNMEKYGVELNETYDAKFLEQANQQYLKKSKYEIKQQEELTKKLNATIVKAMEEGNPTSSIAMEMCSLHKEWICFYWPSYNKHHHLSLVEMYTLDERFRLYYDKIHIGAAQFLLEAMQQYINK